MAYWNDSIFFRLINRAHIVVAKCAENTKISLWFIFKAMFDAHIGLIE